MMHILQNPTYGEDYKEGYIFFSYTSNDIVSEGIALFQSYEDVLHQPLSHCGVISGPNMCVEATDPKVMESNFIEKYVNDPHTIVFLRKPKDLTPQGASIVVSTARQYLGKKYAYLGVVGSALYVMLTAGYKCFSFLRYFRNPLNPKDQLFCSELVANALLPVEGKTGCLKYDPTNIYPITLFDDDTLWSEWDFDIANKKRACGRKVVEIK